MSPPTHPTKVWLCPSCRMFPSMGVYTQFSKLWNNHEREDRVWMGSSRTIKLCRNIVFTLFYCPQLCTHDLVPCARHVTTAGDTCVGPAVTSQCPARLLSTVVAPYIVRVEFICDMVQWDEPKTGLLVSFYKASTGSRTEEMKNCK